MTIVLRRSHI